MAITAPKFSYANRKQFDKVALIDADRYKHVVVHQMWQQLQDGEQHSRELLERLIKDKLELDIFSKFQARAYIFCFSAPSKNVFRNYVSQEKKYKGNRENKPDYYDYENKWEDMSAIYDYIANRYTTLIEEDLEADDLLSMLQHEEDTFIFSHDKDLKQVPGYHYNMDVGQLLYTDEEEGMRLLVVQCLQGDTTDNIPGLRGFGEKAVEKFHEECAGMTQDQMVFCAMQKFIEKHGCRYGVDLFVEMWSLVSMRMNRGQYLRERYVRSFSMIDSLLKKETV